LRRKKHDAMHCLPGMVSHSLEEEEEEEEGRGWVGVRSWWL